jgi:outer membrane protein assembly factor BamB
MRGKAMRCLRKTCRHVFLVVDTPSPNPKPARSAKPATPPSGGVGDIVPLIPTERAEPVEKTSPVAPHVGDILELLPAEPIEAEALPLEPIIQPDTPAPAPHWSNAPPVRRSPGGQQRVEPVGEPRDYDGGGWEVEPVDEVVPESVPDEKPKRRSHHDQNEDTETHRHRHSDPDLHAHPRGRWIKWVIVPFVFLSLLIVGGGFFFYMWMENQREKQWAGEADELFTNGQYTAATARYDELASKYPSSDWIEAYQYRKDLAGLLHELAQPTEVNDRLTATEQFLDARGKDPLLHKDVSFLGEALVKMLTEYARQATQDAKGEEALETIKRARAIVDTVKRIKPASGQKPIRWDEVETAITGLNRSIDVRNQRRKALDDLRAMARPTYASIVEVENYLSDIEARFPDLPGSPEVRRLIEEQYAGHFASIRYVEGPVATKRPSRRPEQEPAILFDPLLRGQPVSEGARDGIVLALVRGVLYAQARSTGQVLWALRVGIDTTALPVRIPARAGTQERLLVLSSDTATLTALDLEGNAMWRYHLPAAVLGRPLVVEQRAYLATYSGEIHEIELIQGKLLGRYLLGQRLTIGGTVDPVTRKLYFPADDGCIYILDTTQRRCERILYTRHPAGSLRGEPIVTVPGGDDAPGLLILNQAVDLDNVRLRVFDLPINDRNAREKVFKTPVGLLGWTWFDPFHDAERLILLSDAGRLGLFGFRQPLNRDQALFPILSRDPTVAREGFNLPALLFPKEPPRSRSRSEVVQIQADDMWVLATDRLQRLRLAWDPTEGPQVIPVWKEAIEVGSPVHASQVLEDRTGRTRLVTVTQPPRRSSTWVTAVDDDQGELLWRRQLGLVCQGAPVPIPVAKGQPIWLTLDQAGALVGLDPTRYVPQKGTPWVSDKRNQLIADSLDANPAQVPVVLMAVDGMSAYVLACPGEGRGLVIRHVKPTDSDRQLEAKETRLSLQAPLVGRPALVGGHVILPLANGTLVRLPLPLPAGNTEAESGPSWRADRVDPDVRCHIVALSGSRFLTTDGARGLAVWEWASDSDRPVPLPADRFEGVTLELPRRVTGLAMVPGKESQVVVSDSDGNLSLINVQANGGLAILRTWSLGGPITTGPFIRNTSEGVRIACVVDRARLVWIDPSQAKSLWTYQSPGDDGIVGEPEFAGQWLVVADQSGFYVALDAKTGQAQGDGYQLGGSIAPAATPVLFQKDRLLAPLSDGTLMLLGVERLTAKRPVPPDER